MWLTDEAENVPDGWDEDDQQVVEGQDGGSDQDVASPAEVSLAEQQRVDGGADLGRDTNIQTIQSFISPQITATLSPSSVNVLVLIPRGTEIDQGIPGYFNL